MTSLGRLSIDACWMLTVSVLLVGACQKAPEPPAQPSVPTATSSPSADEVRAIAKDAYIFTYPLVMNYRTMYSQAIKDDAAFGKWLHLKMSTPADTDIVTPNNDTPYSYAWVDVRAEPWVLTMPKIEKERFYTSQWDDLWGYVIDNPGSVLDGNDGGNYLLASPSWQGDTAKGIKRVVRGESDILGTLTRTQAIGGEKDLLKVEQIQRSYKLQPLSEFLGKLAPAPAPAIDWPAWTEGDETTETYWKYVALMLPLVTKNPADRAMYDKLETLGLKTGELWVPSKLSPATRTALQHGIEDARAEMRKLSEGGVDGDKFFGTREKVGTNYMDRAMGVYMGIFGNVSKISVYLSTTTDANGQPFDGSRTSYTVTFPKGQLPPVDYFWSITMYKLPQRWLVENPIRRYSIGSSTPGMKTNSDGSLTIYVSAKSPGKDKESNWLPAHAGPFWTVLRAYGPGPSIRDGTYKKPDYVPTPVQLPGGAFTSPIAFVDVIQRWAKAPVRPDSGAH
jgi:hypothetical protein